MGRSNLIQIKDLHSKLPEFYRRSCMTYNEGIAFKNDAALAKYLKINRARIGEWINGIADKRAPGMVSVKHVNTLANLLKCMLGGQYAIEEAFDLWEKRSFAEFQLALAPTETLALYKVLQNKDAHLEVKIKDKRVRLVDMDPDQSDPIRRLPIETKYQIQVSAPGAASFILLCETDLGTQLLAPTEWHPGQSDTNFSLVPANNRNFIFREPGGHHCFVAIAHPSREIPISPTPDRSGQLLSQEQLQSIARFLLSEELWYWGDTKVYVE